MYNVHTRTRTHTQIHTHHTHTRRTHTHTLVYFMIASRYVTPYIKYTARTYTARTYTARQMAHTYTRRIDT